MRRRVLFKVCVADEYVVNPIVYACLDLCIDLHECTLQLFARLSKRRILRAATQERPVLPTATQERQQVQFQTLSFLISPFDGV